MNRIVVVFLSFAYVFSGTIALTIKGAENSDGLIRVPLSPLRTRRAADGLAKITMIDYRDYRYGFPVEIGTPPQKFDVMLDTGSEDLWVAWKKADKSDPKCYKICESEHYFDEDKSSTVTKTDKEFYLGFLGGGTKGVVAYDTVKVGSLTVKNQPFGIVYQGIKPESFDGIMGMSYNAASLTDNITTIERLRDQNQIKKAVACVKIRPEKTSKSEFILGGCDVEADGGYAPVIKINGRYTGWRINLTQIVIRSGDKVLGTIEPNHECVVDSGAGSGLGIPRKHMKKIAETLGSTWNGTNHNIIPCDKVDSLPDIDWIYGDAKITMKPDVYYWNYNGECQIALFDNGEDGTFFFGIPIFQAGTLIFDKDENRIGFGKI